MHNPLIFHAQVSLKNMVCNLFKRPMKAIGMAVGVLYFMMLPFMMGPMLQDFNFDTPEAFVVMMTVSTLYVSMPSTMSYFKRKGIVFRKEDVNLTFSTPLSPKLILLYALVKQGYATVMLSVIMVIAAIFVFNVPVLNALIYGVVELVVGSSLSFALAIIMYGSENISQKHKDWIKYGVYIVLATCTAFVVYTVLKQGVSLESVSTLIRHPALLMVPIFGWQLGWLNLMIMGPTVTAVVASVLYVLAAILLVGYAIKMKCTGDYYEDALAFSEQQAIILAKGTNASFGEILGRKRKVHAYNGTLQGRYSQVLFSKQLIERMRTSKYFVRLGDLMFLISSIGLILLQHFVEPLLNPDNFFAILCGIFIYYVVFFSQSPTWKKEFETYFLYLIPDSLSKKLVYATLMEHVVSLLKSILLSVPIGIYVGISFGDLIMTILAQVLICSIVTYVTIFTKEVLGVKVGPILAQILHMITVLVALIVPIIALVLTVTSPSIMGFVLLVAYTLVINTLFIFLCTRMLTSVESLKS